MSPAMISPGSVASAWIRLPCAISFLTAAPSKNLVPIRSQTARKARVNLTLSPLESVGP